MKGKGHNQHRMTMQLWLMRLTSGRDRSTPGHVMLGAEEESDKEKESKPRSSASSAAAIRSATTTTTTSRSHSGFLADDSDTGECRIGGTVLSSYCCVVLLIFAFLFILIGSILTHMYYFAQHSDAQVSQFLHKHSYLKEVSPFVICLGLVMLTAGTAFIIVRRCRRPSPVRYVESPNESYFPPEIDHRSNRGSTNLMIGRNSLTSSAVSSHAVSPLLDPSTAATPTEWKWPMMAATTPPLGGSTPVHPPNANANGSPTPLDPLETEVAVATTATSLTPCSAQQTVTIIPLDTNVIPSVVTIPVSSEPHATETTVLT